MDKTRSEEVHQKILKIEVFRYLGPIFHKTEEDANHSIRVGWMEWRIALGVLCDHRLS